MAITENLETIITARYGREVRQAIHDGIKQAYEDGTANGNANMEVSQARGSYPTLATRLNSIVNTLEKKIAKGQVTMADLTQEVKEALTGGSVAVVGPDAVGEINIQDGAVTPSKVSFADLITDENWISEVNDLSGVTWNAPRQMRLPDGTLTTTQYTTEYRASDFVDVKPGFEYLLEITGATVYAVFFTDSLNDGVSVNLGWISSSNPNVSFTVPAGKTKVSFNITSTGALKTATGLYRKTQFDSEKSFKMPKLVPEQSLQGKVVVNFGDSIFGNTRPPYDISTKLANLTGATVHNCGFGGCRMGVHSQAIYDPFSMYRLAYSIANNDWTLQDEALVTGGQPTYFAETIKLLKSIDFADVDIITIAYGTNDFADGLQPVTATTGEFKATGTALDYSIRTLLTAFPNLRIFICVPAYRAWLDGSYNFVEDSDTKVFTSWVDGPESDHTLLDFVEAEKAVAKAHKLPVIDNYYELGINKFNRTQYFPTTDGTHHNQAGRDLIALHMAKKMW